MTLESGGGWGIYTGQAFHHILRSTEGEDRFGFNSVLRHWVEKQARECISRWEWEALCCDSWFSHSPCGSLSLSHLQLLSLSFNYTQDIVFWEFPLIQTTQPCPGGCPRMRERWPQCLATGPLSPSLVTPISTVSVQPSQGRRKATSGCEHRTDRQAGCFREQRPLTRFPV